MQCVVDGKAGKHHLSCCEYPEQLLQDFWNAKGFLGNNTLPCKQHNNGGLGRDQALIQLTREWLLTSLAKENGFSRQGIPEDGDCILSAALQWYRHSKKTFPNFISPTSKEEPQKQFRMHICGKIKELLQTTTLEKIFGIQGLQFTAEDIEKAFEIISKSGIYSSEQYLASLIFDGPFQRMIATVFQVQIHIHGADFTPFPDKITWRVWNDNYHIFPFENQTGQLQVMHLLRVSCGQNHFFSEGYVIADHYDLLFPATGS